MINPNQIAYINDIVINSKILIERNILDSNHSLCLLNFSDFRIQSVQRHFEFKRKIVVSNSLRIGQNVSTLAGIHIEEIVLIGANSVLTKSVQSNCVVVGVPARIIKNI